MAMEKSKKRNAAELTLRGLVLGVLITLVFTAANVYLGLKVGLTFASSIPAAVISMAVLSVFRGTTILENNIVQTVASAAGTLSAIIFVLPGLVIVGWWTGFPFWTSFLVCASGGILGVLFTIPLRRALVTHSDLPYPEGVAAAEVLKVGFADPAGAEESREGLWAVIYGALASAGLAALSATQYAASEIQQFFRFGSSATGYSFAFSLALFGAGHLVGLSVGMAMLIGLAVAWLGAIPILTSLHQIAADQTLDAYVSGIRSHDVRFIGAGCIAVAALWSLARLAGPVMRGFSSTFSAAQTRDDANNDARDTDLSGSAIIALSLLCFAVIGWLSFDFARGSGVLAGDAMALTVAALPFVLFGGFVIAAICGYMAGLIGASNSPISGVGILAIVTGATLFVATVQVTPENQHALVAFALFMTAIVFGVATISNDNLQDLKTGQLVGAAPWRQQVALVVGVIAGSLIIPPVLNLLAQAYGFAGQMNLPSEVLKPLPAPQASLISALAVGVVGHSLDWMMIGMGGLIGVAAIALDEFMRVRKSLRLPPLAVGLAVYLPMSAVLPVVIGAIIGHFYNVSARRTKDPARSERLGVLIASGLIVGESLFGVTLAGLIVGLSQDTPLALTASGFPWADAIGAGSFALLVVILYGWMMHRMRMAPASAR
jgi:putative OPT family oligopeptide transporter